MYDTINRAPRFDNIYDAMLEGYALFLMLKDEDGIPCDYRILEANKQFANIIGVSDIEVSGKTLRQLLQVSPESWERIHCTLQQQEGCECLLELRGRYFQLCVLHPSEDTVIALLLEVTAQKRAEDALKIHQILFESAQDIILYINEQGRIVDANQRALGAYRITKEQLLTKNILDIRHPSTRGEYEEQMCQAETEGIVFESLHMRSDGSDFPVEVSARGTVTENGPLRIHIIRDITKRKEQEAKIAWLARYDALTGIQNRASFLMQLEQEINRSKRTKAHFAVMLFDIDKFKYINDQYGHEAGDVVLRHVSDEVKGTLRSSDQFGRLGGDEFVVLQTDVKQQSDVIRLAQRIQEASARTVAYNETVLQVSISIGICLFPDDAEDTDTLLLCADKAMYTAKKNGGGYRFYPHNQ